MTEGASSLPDPEVLGIPLSAYAAVLGYVIEGVPLAQSLDHAAISAEEWPRVDAAWSERLTESALGDGALIEACDQHRFAVAAHVERSLAPLDEDLRSWLDFFRGFTAAEDPLALLASCGLVEVDLFRLLSLWQGRASADKEVNEATAQILGELPGPVAQVRPQPPRLKAETRRARRVKVAPDAPAGATGSAVKVGLGETSMVLDLSKIVLPFARSSGTVSFAAAAAKAPVVRARRDFGETKLANAIPTKASLPFGEDESRKVAFDPPTITPAVPLAPPSAPPAAVKRPFAETVFAPGVSMPVPLPFVAPTVSTDPARATARAPVSMPVVVRANPALTGTRMAHDEPIRPALPFGSEGAPASQRPPPSASAPVVNRAPQALASTMPVLGPAAPALPFAAPAGSAAPAPAAAGPRLSLVLYATMHAEITFNPSAALATIARYGLTPAMKPVEDAAWTAKFAGDPGLRMIWMREMVAAANRLRGK
jgi:hypothetical protein